MQRPAKPALWTFSATLLAGVLTCIPTAPAHAHTDHTWFGFVTAEQHHSSTDADGATHSVDMSLRFASATDLGDATATTMTYSYHYRDSYPASVPGVSCSATYDYTGSGTVPASADFILAQVPDQYRVVTTPGAPTEYEVTITFAGPSNCADVIVGTGGTFLGTQSISYESPTPIGPDPLHLEGTTTVPVQQGITGDSTWAWNVDDTNHPPVGANDTATTDAGVGVDINALANDTDPDGDVLDLVSVNDPLGGTALIERGAQVTIRYIPDPDFVGDDVFGYVLADAHGAQDTASIRVTVNGAAGTIVVHPATVPSGAAQQFVYTGAVPATLSDGQSAQRTFLAEHTYTVAQTLPVDGWDLTDITCTNVSATTDTEAGTARFVLPTDTTVTCTFSNRAAIDQCTGNQPVDLGIPEAAPVDWRAGLASKDPGVLVDYRVSATDPEGADLAWSWSFTDHTGTQQTSEPAPRHRWSTSGATRRVRHATVTVTDDCGAGTIASLDLPLSGDPARDFAPELALHPDEKLWPMSVDRFIDKSSLRYVDRPRNGGRGAVRRFVIRKQGDVRPGPLGRGDYAGHGRHQYPTYHSDDYVRPFDNHNAGDQTGDGGGDGMYLDVADSQHVGDMDGPWPVYLQRVSTKLVYWQFYGLSQPMLLNGAPAPITHEGDWERVIVQLDGMSVPTRVGFVTHHEPVRYLAYPDWITDVGDPLGPAPGDVDTHLLAPNGFVALRGHGTHPDVGRTCFGPLGITPVCDYRVAGPRWLTRDRLVEARTRPWFGDPADHAKCRRLGPMPPNQLECGYGGAWGYSGNGGDKTGPLGPSAFKKATSNG